MWAAELSYPLFLQNEETINGKPLSKPIRILERRLTVLTHNGLTPIHEARVGMLHAKRENILACDGILEIRNAFVHPLCALIFQVYSRDLVK